MHEYGGKGSGVHGTYNDLLAPLAEVEEALKLYKDVVNDGDAEEIRETSASLRNDGREMLAEGRLLRLGVVGQVKAGKSSLLNALLFDGSEVLPKAATPMTASLTHILRSDRDEIEIEYYTEAEWDEVVRHAEEYRKAPRRVGHRDRCGQPCRRVQKGTSTVERKRDIHPAARKGHRPLEAAKDIPIQDQANQVDVSSAGCR